MERTRTILGIPIGGPRRESEAPVRLDDDLEGKELLTREFRLPREVKESLTFEQAKILQLLTRAARRTADLFALQLDNEGNPNFYPAKTTLSEILDAVTKNPEIQSPYTIVTRDPEGNLQAIPMHKVYAEPLKDLEVVGLLKEAANTAGRGKNRDMDLQAYLRAKATSLETGDYESSDRIWLERSDEPKVDIAIGLYDTYSDKLLGRKYAWEAWVGVLDEKSTMESQWFLNALLTWWQQHTGQEPPKIKMRIDYTRILAGQAALYDWVGNNLPCQQEWRQKYGSKFTIFGKRFNDEFKKNKLKAFRNLIDSPKRRGASDDQLKSVSLRKHIAHEIGHSLGVASDLETRLQKYATTIKELYCDLLALKGYFGIDGVSPRERELAFAIAFSEGITDYQAYKNNGTRTEYYISRSILLNYCLREGSIQINDRKLTWQDPKRVITNIETLFNQVNQLQISGTSKDVQSFIEEVFDPEVYDLLTLRRIVVPEFLQGLQLTNFT